jgi:predicted benzoate:H+ symporter BenE
LVTEDGLPEGIVLQAQEVIKPQEVIVSAYQRGVAVQMGVSVLFEFLWTRIPRLVCWNKRKNRP